MNAATTHRAIRLRILAECRSEQTEAFLFAQLTGCGRDVIDAVIDSMLDAGELRSSIIDARSVGFGYLPTLTASGHDVTRAVAGDHAAPPFRMMVATLRAV